MVVPERGLPTMKSADAITRHLLRSFGYVTRPTDRPAGSGPQRRGAIGRTLPVPSERTLSSGARPGGVPACDTSCRGDPSSPPDGQDDAHDQDGDDPHYRGDH